MFVFHRCQSLLNIAHVFTGHLHFIFWELSTSLSHLLITLFDSFQTKGPSNCSQKIIIAKGKSL